MRTIHLFAATLAFLLAGCAATPRSVGEGKVQVSVPAELKVLTVNGNEVDAPLLYSGHYTLMLNPGHNVVAVQYLDNWNQADEAGKIVEWQPVLIEHSFLVTQSYSLDYQHPSNYAEAEALVEPSPVWLQTPEGRIEASKNTSALPAAHAVSGKSLFSGNESDASRLSELKRLWNEASPEERRQFWIWIGPAQ